MISRISSSISKYCSLVTLIGGITFSRMATTARQRHGTELVGRLTVYELRTALKSLSDQGNPAQVPDADPRPRIPAELHDLAHAFKIATADRLPPHRPYDLKIDLKEGFEPPFGPLYKLSRQEMKTLWIWIQKNLSKEFIRAFSSRARASILFVKKKDGSLRLCIDYRELNGEIIKNRYSLSLIQKTLNQLCVARYYTILNIRNAYNLLRVAKENE
jgi:hypothetical protein